MSGLTVDRGLVVAFHFSLTDQDGELIDDSSGRPPLSYLHGHGGVVPGLAEAMEGRCEGEHFQVAVPPGALDGDAAVGICVVKEAMRQVERRKRCS